MEIFCPFGFLGNLGWENSSEGLVSRVSLFKLNDYPGKSNEIILYLFICSTNIFFEQLSWPRPRQVLKR